MIGLMTNSAAENGYYEQSTKIVKITLTIITALSAVTIPRIGAYFSNHENDKISHYMYQAYNFVWLLGIPLCFGLAGISKNFVPWFLGDGFEESADLIIILSFLILAIGINNVTGMQYLIPTKRQNLFTISVCIGALVNFVLNSLLIPHFLAAGAAVASVIAETTIAIFQLIIVRKELSIKKIGFMSLKYLIAGIIMLGFLIFENFYLSPSILHTLIII
jgi:O-antigen/teichoic acid export membrane protein